MKKLGGISLIMFLVNSACCQTEDSSCWHEAFSIKEAISFTDSCNIQLSINEYVTEYSSTLVIGKELDACKNLVIFGVGTKRYLQIKTNFSEFSKLEEFGIAGKFNRKVVKKSIRRCRNLKRVGIDFQDSVYQFPKFINYLSSDVNLLLTYNFDRVDTEKILRNLRLVLKKTDVKNIRIRT